MMPVTIMQERLLFACHLGSRGDRLVGILMQDHCLPIACSHKSWRKDGEAGPVSDSGFHALWEGTACVEEFFEALYLMTVEGGPGADDPHNGLWVYEVEYLEDEVEPEGWDHLQGGILRRPTTDEITNLAQGIPPWGGVIL